MRNPIKMYRLPVVVLLLSLAGFGLRQGLYVLALDHRDLLLRGHPLEYLLWAVVAAGILLVVVFAWQLDGSGLYAHNFAPSLTAALGSILFAAGIGATMVTGRSADSGIAYTLLARQVIAARILETAWRLLGWLTVPALVWAGICRRQGKVPSFLCHGAVCLFLLVHTMSQYQRWCNNPQLMDYVFALLATLSLAFFAYYTAAFALDSGSRRIQLGSGLLAVLFGITGLSGGEFPFLYLGGAAFAMTNLCFLLPRSKDEEAAHDPS